MDSTGPKRGVIGYEAHTDKIRHSNRVPERIARYDTSFLFCFLVKHCINPPSSVPAVRLAPY